MDLHPSTIQIVVFVALALWDLVWKGLGLWRAGHRDDGVWFVAILVLNTVGILPIVYLLMTRGDDSGPQN